MNINIYEAAPAADGAVTQRFEQLEAVMQNMINALGNLAERLQALETRPADPPAEAPVEPSVQPAAPPTPPVSLVAP